MSPQSIRRSSMPALTTTTKPSIGLRKLIERPSYLIYLNVEPSLDNLCSPSMPEANRECATDLADVLHAAMEARRAERSRGRVTVYKPSRLRLRTASMLDYSGFTKLRGEMNGGLKCSAVARRT